jgi:hypothetical protein
LIERLCEVGSGCVAVYRILLEQLHDHAIEDARDLGIDQRRKRRSDGLDRLSRPLKPLDDDVLVRCAVFGRQVEW